MKSLKTKEKFHHNIAGRNESQLAGWDDEYPLGIDTDLTCLEILRGSRQQRINEAQAAITGFLFNPYNNESQSPSKAGGIFDAVP